MPDGVPTRTNLLPEYKEYTKASSARATKGSYKVPIGTRGSPSDSADKPNCPKAMSRLVSEIPSSRCWPLGVRSHLIKRGPRAVNGSGAFCGLHTPTWLIHPPRFVEVATSGLT